jgi:aryl-alcohol dehydrogenase-like predicted oxidoreductase
VCEPKAVQNELKVSDPVLEECERAGLRFMPWAPLGEGLGRRSDEELVC